MSALAGGATLLALRASGAAPAPVPAPAAGVAAPAANVHPVDGPTLKKIVAAQKGKVVLLNLWATWCEPCVDEFPAIVKLYNQYRSKGLTVMAVSLDDPDDKAKVIQFLGRQKAAFPAYLRRAGSVEQFFDPVDKKWSGYAPTTYVFGRNGKVVGKPMTGPQRYADFEAAVKPLLK
jgi:thiol-disulfide isomerase/thioredoxin